MIAGLPEEDYTSFGKRLMMCLPSGGRIATRIFEMRGPGLRQQAKQWDYVYMDKAPYEIVKNNVLSFDDIIKIKQVEDILEKYWNQHRMDHTIEYLVSECFETPFDFFQQFGTYWDEQGWPKIGHQLEDLFKRLCQFLKDIEMKHGYHFKLDEI